MKNVVLGFSFAVLASTFAVGCTSDDSSTGDDTTGDPCDNLSAGESCTSATWKFQNANPDGTVSGDNGCPTGFDTGAVISVSEDEQGSTDTSSCKGNSTSSSTCVVDLYDCTAGGGHEALPAGYWAQFVSITDHTGANVYADSIGELVDLTTDNTVNAEIVDNGGYILASWHLTGSATSCADVAGQNGVEIDATLAGSSDLIADAFDCDKGEYGFQYTDPLPAGNYTLSVSLIDANNQALGQADAIPNATVGTQNDIEDIGDINIVVD